MKTKAVRLYGKNDLRLDEFELPEMKDDEILAQVISDSICMSTYKATVLGADHKRVPDDIHKNPTIIGHEFAGIILSVGEKWKNSYKPGQKFTIQPAMLHMGTLDAPGYSYRFIGGDATHIIIPSIIIEAGCLLEYKGESFFSASLAEPMSCIIRAFHACYHIEQGTYNHVMGIKEGGNLAILAGAGPMGLGAIDYALHCNRRPGLITVTDINDERLARAASLFPEKETAKTGIRLSFVNTAKIADPVNYLRKITEGKGYDDVFIFYPSKAVVETGDSILAADGCLNFFAGPENNDFKAEFNCYNLHYNFTHLIGTTGGNTNDMREALELMAEGRINPAIMITHVGGLDSVAETTKNLPGLPGGKKLIYTNISMPLTELAQPEKIRENDKMLSGLYEILAGNNFIWSDEAEMFLLRNAKKI